MSAIDEFLDDVYREEQARAALRIQGLLSIEDATRERVELAVKAERRRGDVRANRRAIWTGILVALATYNASRNGITLPW